MADIQVEIDRSKEFNFNNNKKNNLYFLLKSGITRLNCLNFNSFILQTFFLNYYQNVNFLILQKEIIIWVLFVR